MTFYKAIILKCDHDGCSNRFAATSTRVPEARREAASFGWKNVEYNDYCVHHRDVEGEDRLK